MISIGGLSRLTHEKVLSDPFRQAGFFFSAKTKVANIETKRVYLALAIFSIPNFLCLSVIFKRHMPFNPFSLEWLQLLLLERFKAWLLAPFWAFIIFSCFICHLLSFLLKTLCA